MSEYTNIYHGQAGNLTDAARSTLLQQALHFSAQATEADRAANVEQAIQCLNRSLEIKIQLFGERSIQAALSFNELGESYLRSNDLEAAQRALKKALKVRDYQSVGGLELGPRCSHLGFILAQLPVECTTLQGHLVSVQL